MDGTAQSSRVALKRRAWLAYDRLSSAAMRTLERWEGIDTVGAGRRDPAAPDDAGRVPYRSSGWRMLRRALPRGSVDRHDVFVDLGCGMGRVVYQAAKDYPFRRVIGVEISPQLSEVARDNIGRHRERLACPEVDIVTTDVLSYDFRDDITVVYLYSPFVGDVFRGAVERLLSSYDRRPRSIRLLYANPVEHAFLAATGRARLVARRRPIWRPTAGWRRGETVNEYVLGPTAAGGARAPRRLEPPETRGLYPATSLVGGPVT